MVVSNKIKQIILVLVLFMCVFLNIKSVKAASANITYDFGGNYYFDQLNEAADYLDTGIPLDWDSKFTIDVTFQIHNYVSTGTNDGRVYIFSLPQYNSTVHVMSLWWEGTYLDLDSKTVFSLLGDSINDKDIHVVASYENEKWTVSATTSDGSINVVNKQISPNTRGSRFETFRVGDSSPVYGRNKEEYVTFSSIKITKEVSGVELPIPTEKEHTFSGWKLNNQLITDYSLDSEKNLIAAVSVTDPDTPTIDGGETKIYHANDTALICSTDTAYSDGIKLYYSFGYSDSANTTPTNWESWNTSNTKVIGKDEYVGQRWYACKIMASDGKQLSSTITTADNENAEVAINNFAITFNTIANGGEALQTDTLYSKYGTNEIYTGIQNNTTTVAPQATKTDSEFIGWYTDPTDGDEVINKDGEITPNVSDWTNANGEFIRTSNSTLYAHWEEIETVTITKPDGVVQVPVGSEYNLGENNLVEVNRELYYVYFDYNYGDDSDPYYEIVYEMKEGNGWLIDNVHYDNNSVITVNEDITVNYDFDYPIYPVSIPQNLNRPGYYFGGWYHRYTNVKFTETEWGENGNGDLDLYAKWLVDPVSLTIDGETEMVERGTEYVVPNGKLTDDNYIIIHVSDWLREIDQDVKIGYGRTINYQTINGNNYEPGYKYIVNEDTTITSNINSNKQVVMDPYIETPTTIEYDNNLYVFSGWLFNNWDYVDPMDISIDLNAIKPSDIDLDGQGLFAEYSMYDPETQALIHYKDEYSGIDFTRVVDKGYEFILEDKSTIENVTIQLVDTIDLSRTRGVIEIDATMDHYLINNNEYDPDSSTYIINEDTDIEVVRIISTSGEIGGYGFLIDIEPPARINEYIANNYLFMGIFTEQDGQGQRMNIREKLESHKFYESPDRNISGFIYFLTDPNIILSVDDEISIIEKGVGVIPEGKEKSDDVIPITLVYQDGETPNEVKNITTTYNFEGYMKQDYWRVYNPGEEYDYEEDTYFFSNYETNTIYDELPYIDDDHFKGWWTEPDGGDRIDQLEYMLWYYEDYGYNTLYAHWGEPTVEICHGKGDCEEIVKGTAVTLERPEPTVTTAHFTLDYNTEEPGYDPKEVTTTRTETVEYYMINDERYDFGETYVFNENCDMYGVTTLTYTSDFEGYYSDNWDYGLNINGYELRGWCATTDGRYCRYYDEDDDIVQPDGLTLYANYYQSEGDTVRVTVDWNTTYDWPKGESEVLPDEKYETINFEVPEDYDRDINFDLNNGSGDTLNGSIHVSYEFSHFRVGNDSYNKYQRHDLYTFYKDVHIQSQYNEIYGEIDFPEISEPTFKGWYTKPEGGRKISTTEDFTKYMDLYNSFTLYAQYYNGLPEDITIDSDNVTLLIGEVHLINTIFVPEDSGDTITYTGYDNEIISVTDGLITGLQPGTTTITIGTENTDITETVTVTVIGIQLSSKTLDIIDKGTVKIVIGSEPNTYVSDFINKIDNDISNLKIYDKDNNLIDSSLYDTLLLTTNMTLKLVINDITYDEAVVIIRGDIDGDGIVDVTDESLIMDHILEINLINGNSIYAADLEEDEIVDVSDDSKIMDYILEIVDTLNGGV